MKEIVARGRLTDLHGGRFSATEQRQEVARGAEAVLTKESKDNQTVLVKDRIKKGYRLKEIDKKLRRGRTRSEARLLREARRAGIAVPRVLEEKEFELTEEFLEGARLKELLNETDTETRAKIAEQLGEAVGKLHAAGMVHGDLTTSNMFWQGDMTPLQKCGEEKIYFIDFGLGFFSERAEDFGTDLAVLHEALRSTHFAFLEQLWNDFVAAYRKSSARADHALNALAAIERRGRYVRRRMDK